MGSAAEGDKHATTTGTALAQGSTVGEKRAIRASVLLSEPDGRGANGAPAGVETQGAESIKGDEHGEDLASEAQKTEPRERATNLRSGDVRAVDRRAETIHDREPIPQGESAAMGASAIDAPQEQPGAAMVENPYLRSPLAHSIKPVENAGAVANYPADSGAVELPESAQNQLPETHLLAIENQLPEQLPESAIGVADKELEGFFYALNQLPESTLNQLPEISRGRLWRIEKNGKGGYQWRMRFSSRRISQPAELGPDADAAFAAQPGRGNHAQCRAESKYFAAEVFDLEQRFSAGKRGGRNAQSRKRTGKRGASDRKRKLVRKTRSNLAGGLPDVPTASEFVN